MYRRHSHKASVGGIFSSPTEIPTILKYILLSRIILFNKVQRTRRPYYGYVQIDNVQCTIYVQFSHLQEKR